MIKFSDHFFEPNQYPTESPRMAAIPTVAAKIVVLRRSLPVSPKVSLIIVVE